MKKYHKKYRIVGEFDNNDKLSYSEDMKDVANFIYCDNGYIIISRYSENSLRIDVAGGGRYNNIKDKLIAEGIKIIKEVSLFKEGSLVVEEKNTPKIFRICKAKRQRNNPVSIINTKDNLPYFKRAMRRFNQKGNLD